MSTPPGEPPQEWQPPEPDYSQYGAQPGWSPQPAPTNGMAIGAFVSSLLGLLCGIGFIVGLVLGYVARSQIRQSGGAQGGAGLATAAIVIGWVGVALMVLGFFALFAFIAAGAGGF